VLCFYVALNDFGFPPSQLTMLANQRVAAPNPGDTFSPTHPTFGNTRLMQAYANACPPADDGAAVDWIGVGTAAFDLRLGLLSCTADGGTATYKQAVAWGECRVQQLSPHSGLPVCYSTEAVKYAQTAYFAGLVWAQAANFIACRTVRSSAFTQAVSAAAMAAMAVQISLVLAAAYFQPFNAAFGTRDCVFAHLGIAAIPFCMLVLLFE
jgi:sodium/potassium-transporting ATPase subunit alpha